MKLHKNIFGSQNAFFFSKMDQNYEIKKILGLLIIRGILRVSKLKDIQGVAS